MPRRIRLSLKKYERQFRSKVERRMVAGLEAGGAFIVAELKKVVSVPVVKVGGVVTVRSKPGEPPRLETGFGRAHIVYTISRDKKGKPKLNVNVTENAFYMMVLETGTRDKRIKPRPWYAVTFAKQQKRLAAAIENGMKGK